MSGTQKLIRNGILKTLLRSSPGRYRQVLELLIFLKGHPERGDEVLPYLYSLSKKAPFFRERRGVGRGEGFVPWATVLRCQFPPLPARVPQVLSPLTYSADLYWSLGACGPAHQVSTGRDSRLPSSALGWRAHRHGCPHRPRRGETPRTPGRHTLHRNRPHSRTHRF